MNGITLNFLALYISSIFESLSFLGARLLKKRPSRRAQELPDAQGPGDPWTAFSLERGFHLGLGFRSLGFRDN